MEESSTRNRRSLGRRAEDLAEAYLRLAGCSILERNLQLGHLEIDIVAREGDCLLFVEVRMRRGDRCGSAAESLSPRKRRHLREGLRRGLAARAWRGPYRLDLLALDWNPGTGSLRLEHYRGIS